METNFIKTQLSAYLKNINPKDPEDLLIAMPAVATLSKVDEKSAKPYLLEFEQLNQQEVQGYLQDELTTIYNQFLFNDDLLENAWRLQQFDFFLSVCEIRLEPASESKYNDILMLAMRLPWPLDLLLQLEEFINKSGIPQEDFLPALKYATEKGTKPEQKTFQVTLNQHAVEEIIAAKSNNIIPISFRKNLQHENIPFDFPSGDQTIKSKITVYSDERDIVFNVYSKDLWPEAILFENQLIPFQYDKDELIKVFAKYPLAKLKSFPSTWRQLNFTLYYLGNQKVVFK